MSKKFVLKVRSKQETAEIEPEDTLTSALNALKDDERREKQREHKKNVETDSLGIAVTRAQEGAIRGRHSGTPIRVDWTSVEKLLHIQCTAPEVAGFLGISVNTLHRRCRQDHEMTWGEYAETKKAGGRASLRRKQWLLADKSAAMSIFLGKNILDQADKIESKHAHVHTAIDLNKLTDSDLDTLEGLIDGITDET